MADGSARDQARERASKFGPLLLLFAAVTAWLWPIGFGQRMPVGGDTTQFSMGLMAFLKESLGAGRLPLWNDLWGYGFPGLAESQMGVFYPPHLLLYGSPLTLEVAYTACLVLHVYWGAFGAYFAARCFGLGRWTSAVPGYVFATCGFFFIHIPHQWAYSTGCWMPWAWGLAWLAIRGEGSRRAPLWLAAVLAVQLLPGHFQLAFNTQVGVGLIALTGTRWDFQGLKRLLAVVLAGAAMLPLAALQLIPTYELAKLAEADRDFEYLSGFAATPFHLISYIAPGLFHRSPLWRPLIWDTFHTSPEEHLASAGLVALFLALIGLKRRGGDDRARGVLIVLALATLLLSLGPYVPGFSWLIKLPGFSFFRAPARWSLSTALALALLAGRGLELLPQLKRPGRWLGGFVIFAGVWLFGTIGLIELAFDATSTPQNSSIEGAYQAALNRMPWTGDPTFRQRMVETRQPQNDMRVLSGQARLGYPMQPSWKLSEERWKVYKTECWDALAVLATLLILVPFLTKRTRAVALLLVGVIGFEPILLKLYRPYDLGPNTPLTEQSALLSSYKAYPRGGTRIVDRARNLAMVAGGSPISSYRTLDLPAAPAITRLAEGPILAKQGATEAMRIAGVGLRVVDPQEVAGATDPETQLSPPGWAFRERIQDPVLAGWLDGADLVGKSSPKSSEFGTLSPTRPARRVWTIEPTRPPTAGDLAFSEVVAWFAGAEGSGPATYESPRPEEIAFPVKAPTSVRPTWIVLTQLYHPNWKAEWIDPNSGAVLEPATPVRVLDGWTGIDITGRKADGKLHLTYSEPRLPMAMAISCVAWLVWLGTFLKLGQKSGDEPRAVEPGGGESE